MKLQKIVLALITTIGFIGAAQAGIVSNKSYADGLSLTNDPSATVSGAAVDGVLGGTLTPFSHFTAFGADTNSVYSFISSTSFPPFPAVMAEHRKLGYWAFQGLGHSDAWFGEWAPENKTSGTPNGTIDYTKRTVFYIGNNSNLTLPSSGTVNYSVKGINQYNASPNPLIGTFTASFTGSGGSLSGGLTGGTATNGIKTLSLGTTTFNTAGVITGSATGTNQANAAIGTGTVSGQFFGNQSVTGSGGLAGFAKFANRNYDTAFGGKN